MVWGDNIASISTTGYIAAATFQNIQTQTLFIYFSTREALFIQISAPMPVYAPFVLGRFEREEYGQCNSFRSFYLEDFPHVQSKTSFYFTIIPTMYYFPSSCNYI